MARIKSNCQQFLETEPGPIHLTITALICYFLGHEIPLGKPNTLYPDMSSLSLFGSLLISAKGTSTVYKLIVLFYNHWLCHVIRDGKNFIRLRLFTVVFS